MPSTMLKLLGKVQFNIFCRLNLVLETHGFEIQIRFDNDQLSIPEPRFEAYRKPCQCEQLLTTLSTEVYGGFQNPLIDLAN